MKSETAIHIQLWKLIETYRLPGVLVFHVPNGEWRDIRTARRLKEMGVTPGVPDLCYHAEGRTGYLELKKEDGHLSNDQLDFIALAAQQNVSVDIAFSVIEGAILLQQRGVLDPTQKFKITDDPTSDRRAHGRTVRKRAVRPIQAEAGRVPLI